MKEGLRPRRAHSSTSSASRSSATIRAADGAVAIGATVTHRAVETSPPRCASLSADRRRGAARGERPACATSARWAATSRSPIPTATSPPLFLALRRHAWSSVAARATRELPLGDFVRGPYETARADDEVLTAVRLAPWPAGDGRGLREVRHPRAPDPRRGRGADARGDGRARVADARLAIGCVGPRPAAAVAARGAAARPRRSPSSRRAAIAELADGGRDGIDAVDDLHGSAEYKREMARVFVRRALDVAARRAPEIREARYAHAVVV